MVPRRTVPSDCPGPTSWAYARADVSIPRACEARADSGTRIHSQNRLPVGDLVSFFADIHRAGLYAGNGRGLHAPRCGTVVRRESMSAIGAPFLFGVRV